MIKFFRKIRYNLISANKTGKYLKYAIGEILLVVIGILIALSINNWNENRKSKKTTYEIYKNLLSSLQQDATEIQRIIDLQYNSLETQRKLILNDAAKIQVNLNEKRLEKIAVDICVGAMSFFPKDGIYKLIVSNNGMDLISSNEIKALLINLYDYQYKRYENIDAIVDQKFHSGLIPVLQKNIGFVFEFSPDIKVIRSASPELFISHYSELTSECKDVFPLLSGGHSLLLQSKESIKELSQLLENEIEKLDYP